MLMRNITMFLIDVVMLMKNITMFLMDIVMLMRNVAMLTRTTCTLRVTEKKVAIASGLI